MPINFYEIIFVAFLMFAFAYFSYKKKSLDKEGIVAGFIIGTVSYLLGEQIGISGLTTFLVMVAFFVIAELCTRLARMQLKEAHERRTTGNILGNSGSAIIALFLRSPIGFYGAIAAALADTLSSEIGMLSKSKPRLITNLRKEVEPGVDGGITLLGLFASFVGAFIIALIYFIFNFYYFKRIDLAIIPAITLAGIIGSLIDSILGAVFERKNILNNTTVNFFASGCGAVAAVVLYRIF